VTFQPKLVAAQPPPSAAAKAAAIQYRASGGAGGSSNPSEVVDRLYSSYDKVRVLCLSRAAVEGSKQPSKIKPCPACSTTRTIAPLHPLCPATTSIHPLPCVTQLQTKLAEARAKLEGHDPNTGRSLFTPQTGRAPYFTRHTSNQGVGDYLFSMQTEKVRRETLE